MYYKITNKKSKVYKQLLKMRSDELLWEDENKKSIIQKTGLEFDKFLGNKGQQTYNRVTQYQGFVFKEPEKVDPKIWKRHKHYPEAFVPNTRTKGGQEMYQFITNGLKGNVFYSLLEVLGLEAMGRFTFPYLEIAGETLVLFLDDSMEPSNRNLIEITRTEFQERLKK
ncbi:hypothetical protein [Rufibacter soli]